MVWGERVRRTCVKKLRFQFCDYVANRIIGIAKPLRFSASMQHSRVIAIAEVLSDRVQTQRHLISGQVHGNASGPDNALAPRGTRHVSDAHTKTARDLGHDALQHDLGGICLAAACVESFDADRPVGPRLGLRQSNQNLIDIHHRAVGG